MKAIGMLTLCTVVAGLIGFAAAAEKAREAYELTVEGTVQRIDLEKPFRIKAPDGTTLEAVLKRTPGLHVGHGLRFMHPADMTVKVKENPGRVLVTVKSPKGYFAQLLLFFTAALEPAAVNALTVSTMKKSLENAGVVFGADATKDCRRLIAGKVRKGTRLLYSMRGVRFSTEMYGLDLGGKVLSVTLQNREANEAEARQAYARILESVGEE